VGAGGLPNSGTGTLTLDNGSLLIANGLGIGGNEPGYQGSVRISGGSVATITMPGSLSLLGIGQSGAGTLTIDTGSRMSVQTQGTVGLGVTGVVPILGTGAVLVDSGGTLNLTGAPQLNVVNGSLTVKGGSGVYVAAGGPASTVSVGGNPAGSGALLVTQSGSILELAAGSALNVGQNGSMTVNTGAAAFIGGQPATAISPPPYIAPGAGVMQVGTGGRGTLTLAPSGPLPQGTLASDALMVGSLGTLNIRNGGVATVTYFVAGAPSDTPG
jgi:hypothetical protein